MAEVRAKLTLGQDPRPKQIHHGPQMSWHEFRDEYARLKLTTLHDNTASSSESRLDVCERIIKPRSLSNMANPVKLERLKSELLAGTEGKKPRSPHTVNSYLNCLVAAMNWAHSQEWIPKRIKKQEVPADDPDKGRPLTDFEFARMLKACSVACPKDPDSWRYLLQGLWESGLRVGEAMNLSWDIPGTIRIVSLKSGRPAIQIPGKRQKNRKLQTIPVTVMCEDLLDEHPTQTGWVFNPTMRSGRAGRPGVDAVSRAISDVGEKALIVVNDAGKFASAHDLRRSFGQRMADRGVTLRDLQKLMRHLSFTTTETFHLSDQIEEIGDRINDRLEEPYLGTVVQSKRTWKGAV